MTQIAIQPTTLTPDSVGHKLAAGAFNETITGLTSGIDTLVITAAADSRCARRWVRRARRAR